MAVTNGETQLGTPGGVAVRYAQALFGGDIDTAKSLVDPQGASAFALMASGLGQTHVTGKDLGVGSTSINGDAAVVILVGTFCGADGCITNSSPHTDNPIFRVAERRAGGRWLVTFAAGAAPAGPDVTPSPASVPPATAP